MRFLAAIHALRSVSLLINAPICFGVEVMGTMALAAEVAFYKITVWSWSHPTDR